MLALFLTVVSIYLVNIILGIFNYKNIIISSITPKFILTLYDFIFNYFIIIFYYFDLFLFN